MNMNHLGFGAKLPVSRIKIARDLKNAELPIDNYVREMLEQHGAEIEKAANYVGKDVVLAQRGHLLLANSGVRTTVIDMSKMRSGQDLINGITHNLKINA